MTKLELQQAFSIAKSSVNLFDEDIDILYGFGLSDFSVVYVTLKQIARLIRWQCQQMNGHYDMDAFQEIAVVGRKKFQIIE